MRETRSALAEVRLEPHVGVPAVPDPVIPNGSALLPSAPLLRGEAAWASRV